MDFSIGDGHFLTRHQQLEFSCNPTDGKSNPSKLADSLRNLYILHSQSRSDGTWMSSGSKSEVYADSLSTESDEYLKKYGAVVDNMDAGGLNNFAEGALELCQFYKNDSSKWETSLTEDKIMQLPCVMEAFAENDFGSDSDDVDIPLRINTVSDSHSADHRGNSPHISTATKAPLMSERTKNPDMGISSKVRAESSCQQPPIQQQQRLWQTSCVSSEPHPPDPRSGPFTKSPFSSTSSLKVQASRHLKRPLYQETQDAPPVDIKPSKVGGPYSNFGQKQKSTSTFNQNYYAKKPWWKKKSCEDEEDDSPDNTTEERNKPTPFRTARDQFIINQQKKGGGPVSGANYGGGKKSLGTRRGPTSKFVPPVLNRDSDQTDIPTSSNAQQAKPNQDEPIDERLKGIDPKMIELINNEIMDTSSSLTWSDIAGLDFAKKTIQEIVVWPMLRPDIFTGLRGPPKGLLLFGPPGTGKTLIGKCIASQSKSTFFCISASSLTSKWVGEGEKMVRTLFAVARCHQPAVIFIDEIDSLLSQRSDSEHESSRRIKTEFLVQLDGATTESEDRILVIGATNRPQEIDEAARRRFVKRLLIPLPEAVARRQIVLNLMAQQNSDLNEADVQLICDKTDGYSGADMTNLCREAALGPIRSIPFDKMETITPDQVRPIQLPDFEQALLQVRASVSNKDLELYAEWNRTYGSFGH